ncbi:hypothetical protein ACKWTF_009484 [Chironomus riparius]
MKLTFFFILLVAVIAVFAADDNVETSDQPKLDDHNHVGHNHTHHHGRNRTRSKGHKHRHGPGHIHHHHNHTHTHKHNHADHGPDDDHTGHVHGVDCHNEAGHEHGTEHDHKH